MGVFVSRELVVPERVEFINFIQTTGTQWIDTGFKPNHKTRVVMDFQFPVVPTNWMGLFSARDSMAEAGRNAFSLWANHIRQYRTDFYADGGPTFGTVDTLRHIADKNRAVTSVDSATATNTGNAATEFQSNYTLHLATGWTGGASDYPASVRIFSCQIYDDDRLIRDYWPCRDDGIACLYDKVNKEYAYNAGTNEFIAG